MFSIRSSLSYSLNKLSDAFSFPDLEPPFISILYE